MADKNTALLKEIRDNYEYASNQWKEAREEGATDMRFVSGNPWDENEIKAREDANRPCISLDEINQYLNQAINNLRQNPRGIKINPAGNGATDKTAELHQNLIRGIEYRSNASRSAYIPAFENAIQRSYGFFRISRDYVSGKSFDQEIKIKGILNPDTVLYDPDAKEADWSDAGYCFVQDVLRKDDFKRKYPKAEIIDFSADDMKLAPLWIREDHVIVAEYWKAKKVSRKLLLIKTPEGSTVVYEDELPEGFDPEVLKERDCDEREIIQYITNGVEILEEMPQHGPYIPIIPVIGKEIYVDDGKGSKRVLLSMVRLARDPQKLYAFLCSQEAEEAKLTPKVPFIGAKGQFESDEDAWKTITAVPHAYVQYDPVVDAASGQMLPAPQRPAFQPNFQAYEIAKDSARRAIQAAMGISPLPTAAQRNNEKSGEALKKIASQESLGSFHFTDNFDRALELTGRVIESWLKPIYDTPRDIGIRKDDESHSVIRINDPNFIEEGQQEPTHYDINEGDHDATVSTGPSYQSQHDEVNDFCNQFVGTPLFPQVADLIVRLRNLGPLGDEIADRLTPPQFAKEGSPQQAMGKLQEAEQHKQLLDAAVQHLQAELKKLQDEKNGKVIENEYRLQMEKVKGEFQVTIAQITTKAQGASERLKWEHEAWKITHQSAHEVAMQNDEQGHEQDLAAQSAQQQQAQAAEQPEAAQ